MVDRLLGMLKDGATSWESGGMCGIPVWAPPPCTPMEGYGSQLVIPNDDQRAAHLMIPHATVSEEILDFSDGRFERWRRLLNQDQSPMFMSIRDDTGQTVSGLDNRDDAQLALEAVTRDKSFRDDYGSYQNDYTLFARLEQKRRRGFRDEQGRASTRLPVMSARMSQLNPGRPEVSRRPQQRDLSTENIVTIRNWFEQIGIDKGNACVTQEQADLAMRLAYTWRDCFVTSLNGIKCTDLVQHDIVIEEGAVPYRLRQPRYTPKEREFAIRIFPQMELADLIEMGIAEWGAHTRFPPKKSGDLRVAQDYRPVNSVTIKPQWPVHSRDGVFYTLIQGDHSVFFQGDAAHGYWGVMCNKADWKKAAFIAPDGQWLNKRMAMGLAGSAHTYCALGDIGFGGWPTQPGTAGPGLPNLMGHHPEWNVSFDTFVDDHNASAKTFDDMFNFLHHHYFPRISFIPMGLAPKKTVLFSKDLASLGFELSQGRIRPSAKHRDRFARWAIPENQPRNVKELEEFLYLTPYLKSYIPGRTDLEGVLRDAYTEKIVKLTPKGRKSVQRQKVVKPFGWGPAQQDAFAVICNHVQERAIRNPEPLVQYHLAVDTSGTGVGGVLFQLDGQPTGTAISDQLMPAMKILLFLSFKLADAETRYNTGERETLGIVKSLAECRWLVITSPHPIMLYCDHANLLKTFSNDNSNKGRIATWLERLGEYSFIIQHRPNTTKIIHIADGLSRLTGPTCELSERVDTEKLPFILDCTDSAGIRPPNITTLAPPAGPRRRNDREPTGCVVQIERDVTDTLPSLMTRISRHDGDSVFPFSAPAALDGLGRDEREHARLKREYGNTIWYGKIVEYLLNPDITKSMDKNARRVLIRRAARYRIIQGILRYVEKNDSLSYCVLPGEVQSALDWAHDGHGHFAMEITLRNLYGHFWWPDRYRDVEKRCRSCPVCAETGNRLPGRSGRMLVTRLNPWELVGMDYIGPISPAGPNGARYILVVVDYFSRWAFGRPTREVGWHPVSRLWEEILVPIFGFPEEVYCDNAFRTRMVKALFEGMGTRLTHGPAYSSWSHGLVEMTNRLIMGQLRKWAATIGYEGLERWSVEVPRAVSRVNARKLPDSDLSPAEVMLGWQTRCAKPVLVEGVEAADTGRYQLGPPAASVLSEMRESLEERRSWIREKAGRRQEKRDDPGLEANGYDVGEWVWEYLKPERDMKISTMRRRGPAETVPGDDARAPKLRPRWTGPYEITAILSDVSVRVVDTTTRTRSRKLHVDNLKPYFGDEPEYTNVNRGPTTAGTMGVRELLLEDDSPDRHVTPNEPSHRLDLRPRILAPPTRC